MLSGPQRESLCEAKEHKKIIEKGKPDDVVPGIRHKQEPLPSSSLSGMVNKYGSKVRLHFKLESEQLWIGTKGIGQCTVTVCVCVCVCSG